MAQKSSHKFSSEAAGLRKQQYSHQGFPAACPGAAWKWDYRKIFRIFPHVTNVELWLAELNCGDHNHRLAVISNTK